MKTLLKALVCVLIFSGAAKADSLITWDFSFYMIDQTTKQPIGVAIGSGTFQTLSLQTDNLPGYYPIVSLDGTMNGDAMTLVGSYPADNAIDATLLFPTYPFYYHAFQFAVDGIDYSIFDNDSGGPIGGNVLAGGGQYNEVQLSVVQEPVSAPEASTIALLLVGLGGLASVALFWKRGLSVLSPE